MEPTKVKTSPKDFFLHLGIIVTLYISAISLVNLLFSIIDKKFPDALSNAGYYYDAYSGSIRWAVSMLIIMFPLYLFLGWLFNRELKVSPEKKLVGVRKWLVFLTLFLAGLTLSIDLVTLIYTFLGGEITTRFVYKVVAVLVVAGLIFAYYIYDLLHDVTQHPKIFKTFASIAGIFVLGSIIAGFMVMGSPMNQRKLQFDQDRINDLQSIQSQVTYYWQQKGMVPKTLAELQDPLSGYSVPTDPETGAAYTYQFTGALSFKVCAVFDLATQPGEISRPMYDPSGKSSLDYWKHKKGETCFDRTIDPQLYPRNTQPQPKGV